MRNNYTYHGSRPRNYDGVPLGQQARDKHPRNLDGRVLFVRAHNEHTVGISPQQPINTHHATRATTLRQDLAVVFGMAVKTNTYLGSLRRAMRDPALAFCDPSMTRSSSTRLC